MDVFSPGRNFDDLSELKTHLGKLTMFTMFSDYIKKYSALAETFGPDWKLVY